MSSLVSCSPKQLRLEHDQLTEIRDLFAERIQEGLARDNQQIRALPAYLPKPRPGIAGTALALDLGGTNARAALVEFTDLAEYRILRGPIELVLPTSELSVDEFFALQAELLRGVASEPTAPLGYCFSFPSVSLPDGSAQLIKWTKGVFVPQLLEHNIVPPLRKALENVNIRPSRIQVVNDTVASLLTATFQPHDGSTNLGLIVGTGTNMALFLPSTTVPKLDAGSDITAINLESGNFHPPHLCSLDDDLDHTSSNRGYQRFEKATSGFYLPQLFNLAATPESPARSGADLALLSSASSPDGEWARALLLRSADLIATGLAAAARCSRAQQLTVMAEGSLFWRTAGYRSRAEQTFKAMAPDCALSIGHVENANLLGAAVAVLVRNQERG